MSANWIKVYDLSQDRETVALIQKASQQTAEFGFVPEVAVFGSDEWWAAVEDGRIEQHTIEGVITRLYMSGHGDWPEFEVESGKEITRWTLLGSHNAYRVGKMVRIEYVLQRLKKPMQPEPVKQVLKIWVERT